MALHELTLQALTDRAVGGNSRVPATCLVAAGRVPSSRAQRTHPGGIPAHIRALIPRTADGTEPFFKFFAGGNVPRRHPVTSS
ncbi:hypothetical protein PI125_g16567 [Phytophthora idaei]|nr:hypothetical protein PI125_g16567 [Phytophthora idaei]KAG3142324.1 hypothetical protein PI126_g15097 [Phytophthora idaei]